MYIFYKAWFFLRYTLIKKYHLDYFAIFFGVFWLFAWLGAAPVFSDPDAFYHAKLAELLGQGKIILDFPWLQATNLINNFADQHFLYHLILAPFTIFFNTAIGLKMATALINATLILSVYTLFKKYKIRFALIYILPLLICYPWLFRAGLIKAAPLFLLLVIWFFDLLAHRRAAALFIVSFFGVWLYGAWPLLGVMVVLYTLINWLLEKLRLNESIINKFKTILLFSGERKTVWPQGIIYVFSGLLAGLIINPYFPHNLKFYGQQIWQIALLNYQSIIPVGGEWYPYTFDKLWLDANSLLITLLFTIILFITTIKKQSIYSWLWGTLTLLFLVLTLKSQRYIDFLAPITVLFFGFTCGDYLKTLSKLHLKLMTKLGWQFIAGTFCLVLAGYFIYLAPEKIILTKNNLNSGSAINIYEKSSDWLKQNTPAGTLILNTNWSDFPALFYQNSDNYYLTGLDPTFSYRQNPEKYQRYREATLGKRPDLLRQVIIDDWHAKYIFSNNKQIVLNKQLSVMPELTKVYSDEEGVIYKVN